MPIMKDMMDKADWEKMDKGLPVGKKAKPVFDDPKQPSVRWQIDVSSISAKDLESITGQRKNVHNKEGVTFIGYDVQIQVKDEKLRKGWMTDGDLIKLKKAVKGRKDVEIQVAE